MCVCVDQCVCTHVLVCIIFMYTCVCVCVDVYASEFATSHTVRPTTTWSSSFNMQHCARITLFAELKTSSVCASASDDHKCLDRDSLSLPHVPTEIKSTLLMITPVWYDIRSKNCSNPVGKCPARSSANAFRFSSCFVCGMLQVFFDPSWIARLVGVSILWPTINQSATNWPKKFSLKVYDFTQGRIALSMLKTGNVAENMLRTLAHQM